MKLVMRLLAFPALAALLIGCAQPARGPLVDPAYNPTATATTPPPTKTPRPTSTPIAPTPIPLELSARSYALSSRALTMILPTGWEVESESDTYLHVVSPEEEVWLEAAVDSTGYELNPLEFEAYVRNVMNTLYGSAVKYELQESSQGERDFEFISTFDIGDEDWNALDVFLQRGKVVYTISFHATDRFWRHFLPSFRKILESVETNAGYIKGGYVYQFSRLYNAPNGSFTLHVPIAWEIQPIELADAGVLAEQIVSPDEEARVQVYSFNAAEQLTESDMGQITIEFIKTIEGEDTYVVGDAFLDDGRVAIEWRTRVGGLVGQTYFWLNGSELNLLTFRRESEHIIVHQPRLADIANSFRFRTVEDN